MVNTHVRRQLLELQHFILRPSSSDAKIDVYSQMITRSLIEHGKSDLKLPYDAILYHIEKDNHFKELPKTLIDIALDKLKENNDIVVEGQFITLSQNKVDEINENISESEKLRESVLHELQEKLCEKLPQLNKSKIDTILENFEEYLALTFQRYGLTLAKILMDKNNNNKLMKGLESPQNYLDAMMQMVPEDKRQGVDKIFNDFLYNPTENLSNYLYALAQSYIILQILNTNPDLKKIQEIAWNKKTIYLDTNVLMPLLFEGDEKNSSICSLIENTIQLGATVLVSETTIKEFTNKLLSFKSNNSTASITRKLSFAKEVDHDDQMLKSYIVERGRYTGLTVENFCLKYENYEILLEKLGVKVDDDYTTSIEEHPLLEDLIQKLKSISARKSNVTGFHDAYHILKVKELRKTTQGDEIGPAFWFLTADHSLSRTEREIFGELDVFSSIMTEVWINFIANFLSPKMTVDVGSKAFTKLLSSTFNSHKIKQGDLNNLMTVFMNDDKFTNSELRLIIGDKFAKDTLRQIKDVLDDGKEIPEKTVQELVTRVKDLITEESERKRQEDISLHQKERKEDELAHKKEINKLETKLDSLHKELGGVKTASITAAHDYSKLKITLYAILISGAVDAISSLALNNFLPLTTVLWVLLGLLGIEAIIILTLLLSHHIKSKNKVPWSRSDKLAVIGIILGILSVIGMLIGLYFIFNPVNVNAQ